MENSLYSEEPVAVYNTDKKELIGVFITLRSAGKYIYDNNYCVKERGLRSVLFRKSKFHCEKLDCMVTVRMANTEQKSKLDKTLYYLSPGYPAPTVGISITKEFDSSRLAMSAIMNARNKPHATTSKT